MQDRITEVQGLAEHTWDQLNRARYLEYGAYAKFRGKINKLEDNFVVLQVADNVELKFQRTHINAVLPKGTLKSI